MASKKTKTTAKRAPFLDRFTNRVEKTLAWAQLTEKRFATAPHKDVPEALGAITDSLESIVEALPKLSKWTPPTRSPAFVVGDSVSFKPAKLDELVKAGFYKKADLEGDFPIEAINGRKVKLPCGVFQSLYVTKVAA